MGGRDDFGFRGQDMYGGGGGGGYGPPGPDAMPPYQGKNGFYVHVETLSHLLFDAYLKS